MSSRITIDVDQLPAGCRLDTYADGTVWLRGANHLDQPIRLFAEERGHGPGRDEGAGYTDPRPAQPLPRRPDTGERRRRSDVDGMIHGG